MPTQFTSYWGSSLHGVQIDWTNDPTATTPELAFTYTANYYWRMPFWYDDTVAGDKAIATASCSNCGYDIQGTGDNAVWGTYKEFYFQFFIAHPTTANVFDGFDGRAWGVCTMKATANGGSTDIHVEWKDKATTDNHKYDLKPASDYDITTADGTTDDWTLVDTAWDGTARGSGTQLCVEKWQLSTTAVACVKMSGKAKRVFASTDADDISFDYVDYQIST